LVERGNAIRERTKLRFVHQELWRAVRGVKGLAMNPLRVPLTPLPARKAQSVS